MTQEKPQPLEITRERENLYLSLKNTTVDKNISHNLSQPDDKIRLDICVKNQKYQTHKIYVCILLDFCVIVRTGCMACTV